MSIKNILAEIDAEIDRLQKVRSLLGSSSTTGKTKKVKPAMKRHKMSKEGRAKIAEAQRKRWAKQKKVTKEKAPF
jgi:hypothetical protein